ncbi:hypothetical protein NQZ68_016367 [Dissostichus eleginoides]|nr:hypothetical protein NQZ68_016367 [Dissostichus eleginoides]
MEHIDQEGHQLPKKGQTISRMPSASPLFTDTDDVGNLQRKSISGEIDIQVQGNGISEVLQLLRNVGMTK